MFGCIFIACILEAFYMYSVQHICIYITGSCGQDFAIYIHRTILVTLPHIHLTVIFAIYNIQILWCNHMFQIYMDHLGKGEVQFPS